jgi:2-polyprenyl-6-hydroxyphenyl methylase/3-demethylubiquinone-9 3-methyltransferase
MKSVYRRFYQDVGRKYPESEIVYRSLRGRLRAEFIRSVMAGWKGRLLDIGCNTGEYLKTYNGGSAVGADISMDLLYKAKRAGIPAALILGDAEDLGFLKPDTFDHVLCSEVLEHVFRPQAVMQAIGRLLKPGGSCLITTPEYDEMRPDWVETGTLGAYGIRGMKGERYFHTAFHAEELAAMAVSAGLEIRDSGTLEKEVRYAAKLPAFFFVIIRWFNACVFRSSALDRWNQSFFDRFSCSIYRMMCLAGLNAWMVRRIPRGVRSYVMAEKPS